MSTQNPEYDPDLDDPDDDTTGYEGPDEEEEEKPHEDVPADS